MIQALPEVARPSFRSWWWVVVALVALGAVGLLSASPRHTSQPFHFSNPDPAGMMALAQVLQNQGVSLTPATTLAELGSGGQGATVFVPDLAVLTEEEIAQLAEVEGDLVIGGSPFTGIGSLTAAVTSLPVGSTAPLAAECADPDAAAAGTISGTRGSLARADNPAAVMCFPTAGAGGPGGATDGAPGSGAPGSGAPGYGYAVWQENGRTIRYIADHSLLTNEQLAQEGNAALGLRALGHRPDLIWYQPTSYGAGLGTATVGSLPPAAGPFLLLGAGVVVLLAVWRGRRMGRVVVEKLPVIVKPGESIYGRGSLYQRNGTHGHAAAGLRAGSARRLAVRLGVPRSAGAGELVGAIGAANGWPEGYVGGLLYGPEPRNDAGLVRLAAELHELEESTR